MAMIPRIHLHCRITDRVEGALCRHLTTVASSTTDPAAVTCQNCRRKYDRLPPEQQQRLRLPVAQEEGGPGDLADSSSGAW